MSITLYDVTAPMLVRAMASMKAWMDKALAEGKSEAALIEARLAPDMRPFAAQIQMASDSAKAGIARLAEIAPPAMPDTETTFAELKDRCQRTIDFIENIDRAQLEAGADREVLLKFPNGMGYRFTGERYATDFLLPNFFFHVTTAYAILRNQGVALGKPDFLQHLGMPEQLE